MYWFQARLPVVGPARRLFQIGRGYLFIYFVFVFDFFGFHCSNLFVSWFDPSVCFEWVFELIWFKHRLCWIYCPTKIVIVFIIFWLCNIRTHVELIWIVYVFISIFGLCNLAYLGGLCKLKNLCYICISVMIKVMIYLVRHSITDFVLSAYVCFLVKRCLLRI